MGLEKNVASQKWMVFAFDRTNNQPKTGDAANITAKIRKDFGAATALGDVNPAEIEDGYYEFDLTQAEVNAKVLDNLPESSTANIQVIGVPGRIFTVAANISDVVVSSNLIHAQANQLGAQAKLDVNGEVTDNLRTDTMPELPVGLPPTNPSIIQAIMLLYHALRDASQSTATEHQIKNDAGTVIAKQTLSDDNITYKREKMVSG